MTRLSLLFFFLCTLAAAQPAADLDKRLADQVLPAHTRSIGVFITFLDSSAYYGQTRRIQPHPSTTPRSVP
jgi:hypothetical protein